MTLPAAWAMLNGSDVADSARYCSSVCEPLNVVQTEKSRIAP